jgi:hypothetical protein
MKATCFWMAMANLLSSGSTLLVRAPSHMRLANLRHARPVPMRASVCAKVASTSMTKGAATLPHSLFARPSSFFRSTWSRLRCSYDVCTTEFRPFKRIRSLFPRKRALRQLRMCEEGTYKVNRAGGQRLLEFHKSKSEECNLAAVELF